jgi:hypothetical protein
LLTYVDFFLQRPLGTRFVFAKERDKAEVHLGRLPATCDMRIGDKIFRAAAIEVRRGEFGSGSWSKLLEPLPSGIFG